LMVLVTRRPLESTRVSERCIVRWALPPPPMLKLKEELELNEDPPPPMPPTRTRGPPPPPPPVAPLANSFSKSANGSSSPNASAA
jgi:hypothetical protein